MPSRALIALAALPVMACGVLSGASSLHLCWDDCGNELAPDGSPNGPLEGSSLPDGSTAASGGPACVAPFADCDHLPGCETDTSTSTTHCGGCGIACDAGEKCVDKTCRRATPPASCKALRDEGNQSPDGIY